MVDRQPTDCTTGFLMPNDHDPRQFAALQDPFEVAHQLLIVDLAEAFGVLFQLVDRFGDLRSSAVQITPAQVVEADRRLDQSLVKEPQRSLGYSPQVFPPFVSFEIAAGVKKIYSFSQEMCHWKERCNLLRSIV